MDDVRMMRRALELAERGRYDVPPNPMVGCVVVGADGGVVGEGWHERVGGPHAEVLALRAAGTSARDATVFVTLEPCAHTGRTPPCTDALVAAGVGRVVVAHRDPNPAAAGGVERLRRAGIPVDVGLLADDAARQNAAFLHAIGVGRPYVFLKSAVSLDGRVAAADGTARWLTGPRAREHAHRLRAEVGAVLVGSGTVLADDPRLTVRLDGWTGRQPLRVVLDGRGRCPSDARVLDDAAPSLVLVAPGTTPDALAARGVEIAEVATDDSGHLDPVAVLAELHRRGVRSVLVEGGPTVTSAFLRAGCYERLVVHVAPLLLGSAGMPAVVGGPATLADASRFALERVEHVGDDAVLELSRPHVEPAAPDVAPSRPHPESSRPHPEPSRPRTEG